jgi:nicotinamidase-related amidase
MPLSALDTRTALVLIDLQEGIAAMAGRERILPIVHQAARLADGFRTHKLPVVLVRVAFSADGGDRPTNRVSRPLPAMQPPPNFAEIMPELRPSSEDLLVTKRQPGAFYGTDLDLQLRRRGISGIVLGGVATSNGVESTARAAFDHGYNVTFAANAMADFNPIAHEHSLTVSFPRLGEIDTTDAIVAALGNRS